MDSELFQQVISSKFFKNIPRLNLDEEYAYENNLFFVTKTYKKQSILSILEKFIHNEYQKHLYFLFPTSLLLSKTKFYQRLLSYLIDRNNNYLSTIIFFPDGSILKKMRSTLLVLDKTFLSLETKIFNLENLPRNEIISNNNIPGIKIDIRDILLNEKTIYELVNFSDSENKTILLQKICKIFRGEQLRNSGFISNYLSVEKFPNIGYADESLTSIGYMDERGREKSVEPFDIILTTTKKVGKCCIVSKEYANSTWVPLNTQVVLRVYKEMLKNFPPVSLYLYLCSQEAKKWIKNHTSEKNSSMFSRILLRDIKEMPIPIFTQEQNNKYSEIMEKLQNTKNVIVNQTNEINSLLSSVFK